MKAFKFQNNGSPTLQCNHPADEGSQHLCNISIFLPDYMAQKPRRQLDPMSFSLKKSMLLCSIMQNNIFWYMRYTNDVRK
jgi:hypothetical protein